MPGARFSPNMNCPSSIEVGSYLVSERPIHLLQDFALSGTFGLSADFGRPNLPTAMRDRKTGQGVPALGRGEAVHRKRTTKFFGASLSPGIHFCTLPRAPIVWRRGAFIWEGSGRFFFVTRVGLFTHCHPTGSLSLIFLLRHDNRYRETS